MTPIFWTEFGTLFAACLVGSAAVLPYGLRLLRGSAQKTPLKMSIPKLVLLSVLQSTVVFAIVTAVGLLAAHAIGLGAPYIEAAITGDGRAHAVLSVLQVAVILGALAGAVLLAVDLLFLLYWPQPLIDTARQTTLWENFAASFYGGINEEVSMRLFGLSALAWLFSKIWHTSEGLPTGAVFWAANALMAILFGIGHLPALKSLLGRIPPRMLARTLLLNAPVGLLCGWLFWTYGIEAAIMAHFSVDIVYHVFGTLVLRRKLGAA